MNKIRVVSWTIFLLTSFLTLLPGAPRGAGSPFSVDYWPTHGWRTTTPEKQGMDSGKLADMMQTILERELNVHSITIVRNGNMVMDSYFFVRLAAF